jgi:hypothetical protein
MAVATHGGAATTSSLSPQTFFVRPSGEVRRHRLEKLFGDVISASGSLIAGMVRNAEWSVTLAVCRRGAV